MTHAHRYEHIDEWPRHEPTGISMVPPARFMPANGIYGLPARLQAHGELPVLRGWFGLRGVNLAQLDEPDITFGVSTIDGVDVVKLCVKHARHALLWLANPYDPELWQALQAWHDANRMVLVAEFPNGHLCAYDCEFSISDALAQARPATDERRDDIAFATAVANFCVEDQVFRLVTARSSGAPPLGRAQACMVLSANDNPVFVGPALPNGVEASDSAPRTQRRGKAAHWPPTGRRHH